MAPGRGGAAWLSEVAKKLGLTTTNNEVDIGVRVEVPNSVMDHLTRRSTKPNSSTIRIRLKTKCVLLHEPRRMVSEEHYESGIAVVNGHSYTTTTGAPTTPTLRCWCPRASPSPSTSRLNTATISRSWAICSPAAASWSNVWRFAQGRRTDASRLEKSTTIPTLKTAVPGDLSFVLPHRHLTASSKL